MPRSQGRRYLTGAELDRFLVALAQIDDQQAAAIFRLLLMTGARKSEVLSMQWGDIDLDCGIWNRPASATKRKDRPRAPLSKAVIAILRGLPHNEPFVFPSGSGRPRTELRPAWTEICRAAGLENFHIHDLRHSFASFAIQSGASLEVIGGLLGHRRPQTTSRYAHLDDAALRAVAERVGQIVGKK